MGRQSVGISAQPLHSASLTVVQTLDLHSGLIPQISDPQFSTDHQALDSTHNNPNRNLNPGSVRAMFWRRRLVVHSKQRWLAPEAGADVSQRGGAGIGGEKSDRAPAG